MAAASTVINMLGAGGGADRGYPPVTRISLIGRVLGSCHRDLGNSYEFPRG